MSEESGWKIGSTFSKATIYKTTVIVREEDDIIVAFAQNDEAARKIVAVPEMIDALVNARSMLSAFRDNSGTVDQIDRILNDIGQGMI